MRVAALILCTGCSMMMPRTSTTTGTTSTSTSTSSDPEPAYSATDGSVGRGLGAPDRVEQRFYLPLADAPADPWAGVAGEVPIALDDTRELHQQWTVREEAATCTAVKDHCLPAPIWFWLHEGERGPSRTVIAVAFLKEGPAAPNGAIGHANEDNYTAYRTVPATRANLVEGALVVSHPQPIPKDTKDAFDRWQMGEVERVDWDLGFVFFKQWKEPRYITSTRVAVLSYAPGGKVTIIGDLPRDQLAVKAADVILPDP